MDIPDDHVRIAFLGWASRRSSCRADDDDRRCALPREQGRGLPSRLPRGPEPRRSAHAPRDRRDRAHRLRSAARGGRPGRVPAPALVPWGPGRADRGARRAVVGVTGALRAGSGTSDGLRGHQREHQRQATTGRSGGSRRVPSLVRDEEVGLPLEEQVLDERLDPQPGVDRRSRSRPAVVPAVLGLLADIGRRVGIEPCTEKVSGSSCPSTVAEAELPAATPSFSKTSARVDLRDEDRPPGARK